MQFGADSGVRLAGGGIGVELGSFKDRFFFTRSSGVRFRRPLRLRSGQALQDAEPFSSVPATRSGGLLSVVPPGRNLTLTQTLKFCATQNLRSETGGEWGGTVNVGGGSGV